MDPDRIPAIILGHMSRAQIKKSMGRLKGDGMALAGLVMGYISVGILPFVLLIVAAIAIPNLLRARIAANEASAVQSLRYIDTSNVTYASIYGVGFAKSLEHLGGQCSSADSWQNPNEARKDAACLIGAELATGQKSGYRFTYTAVDSDDDGVIDKYFIEAEPLAPNSSGHSTYCTDETGVIRKQADGSRCTVGSPAL